MIKADRLSSLLTKLKKQSNVDVFDLDTQQMLKSLQTTGLYDNWSILDAQQSPTFFIDKSVRHLNHFMYVHSSDKAHHLRIEVVDDKLIANLTISKGSNYDTIFVDHKDYPLDTAIELFNLQDSDIRYVIESQQDINTLIDVEG